MNPLGGQETSRNRGILLVRVNQVLSTAEAGEK